MRPFNFSAAGVEHGLGLRGQLPQRLSIERRRAEDRERGRRARLALLRPRRPSPDDRLLAAGRREP